MKKYESTWRRGLAIVLAPSLVLAYKGTKLAELLRHAAKVQGKRDEGPTVGPANLQKGSREWDPFSYG